MNLPRMLELIEVLKRVPEDKLRMDVWATQCGTVCCAAGWAAQHRPFDAQGFSLTEGPEDTFPTYLTPYDTIHHREKAVMGFFDLGRWEFEYVFISQSYFGAYRITPMHVVSHVLGVIQSNLKRGQLFTHESPYHPSH